jgi:ubiquitin carboxyl-terminal hydrolase 8
MSRPSQRQGRLDNLPSPPPANKMFSPTNPPFVAMPDGPIQNLDLPIQRPVTPESGSLALGASPKRKPLVPSKPQGLSGSPRPHTTTSNGVDAIQARFAALRVAGSSANKNPALALPNGRIGSATPPVGSGGVMDMPSPGSFGGDSSASLNELTQVSSAPAGRPSLNGPRQMPTVRNGPGVPPKLPLDTSFPGGLPKAPSPTYSPARNLQTPAGINPPRSTARSLAGTGGRSSSIAQSSAASFPPGETSNTNSYFPQSISETSEMPPKRSPIKLPRETAISAQQLYDYLHDDGSDRPSILIVDLRDRSDFDEGHIFSKSVICVEPLMLRADMSSSELEEAFVLAPEVEQNLFSRRHEFDLLVYHDQYSTSNRYLGGPSTDPQEKILRSFNQTVYEMSPYDRPLPRAPVLLIGGIDAWADLVGFNSLKTSSTNVATTAGRSRFSKPSRPLGRVPMASQNSTLAVRRRRMQEHEPLNVEEEKIWMQRVQSESGTAVNIRLASDDDSKANRRQAAVVPEDRSPGYSRTVDEFIRRYPESGEIQESMVAPAPYSPRPSTDYFEHNGMASPTHYEDLTMPNVPARPAPAVPRQSYGGVSERQARQQANQPLPAAMAPPRPSMQDTISTLTDDSRGITGLKNLGNTCYMNSTLQCLNATRPLTLLFLNGGYKQDVVRGNKLGSNGLLPEIYANVIKHLWNSYTWISPKTLRVCSTFPSCDL